MKTKNTYTFLRLTASFAFAAILALSAGCGGGGESPGDSNESDANGSEGNGSAQWWQKKDDVDSGEKKLRVAFVTNQIADFWNIAKAGCRDAEKDH